MLNFHFVVIFTHVFSPITPKKKKKDTVYILTVCDVENIKTYIVIYERTSLHWRWKKDI